MPESPEARRTALLSIDHSQLVDMYIAESALVDQVTGERDRARNTAVEAGAFDEPWEIGPRVARVFRVTDSTTGELIAVLSQEFQARWHDEYWRNKGRAVEFKVLETYAAHQDWKPWTPGGQS